MDKIQIIYYQASNGKEPFTEWLSELDPKTSSIIDIKIGNIRKGAFGDCKRLKQASGVWEFRITYGPGYRIYFGMRGNSVILLLGGQKGSQVRDISKAERYWLNYQEAKNGPQRNKI